VYFCYGVEYWNSRRIWCLTKARFSHLFHVCGFCGRVRKCSLELVRVEFVNRSTILPHLTYSHTIWYFCKLTDRRKLERVQERAMKAIFNSKTDTYAAFLRRARLPSLYNRRLQDVAILMFKVKNGEWTCA